MRKITYGSVLVALFLLTGCGGNNSGAPANAASPRVFAAIEMPANEIELQALIDSFPKKYAQIREKIVSAPTDDWEHVIEPLQTFLSSIDDARGMSNYLIDRGRTAAMRALAQEAYGLALPFQNIVDDPDVVLRIKATLGAHPPQSELQQNIAKGLGFPFSTPTVDLNVDLLTAINADLIPASFAFYNNAATKSAVSTFTAEEFACLPDETKATLATDANGNYLFNSRDDNFYWTVITSCVAEPIREKLFSTRVSSAYQESQPLMGDILSLRYKFAIARGDDTWADSRLKNKTLMGNSDHVSAFLSSIADVTNPAFQKLSARYKDIQAAETGTVPDTVYAFNRSRYNAALREQTVGSVPATTRYFEFHKTVSNLFHLAGNMFGLDFVRSATAPEAFGPDVTEYKVYDRHSGIAVGTLIFDPFYREGAVSKWAITHAQSIKTLENGQRQAPVAILYTGLKNAPTNDSFYISSDSVTTLSHELGHALNFMIGDYPNRFNADTDEIPSMFMQLAVQTPRFIKALLSDDPDHPLADFPAGFVNYWEYSQPASDKIEAIRYSLAVSDLILELANWRPGDSTDLGLLGRQVMEKFYYPYPVDSHPGYNISHLVTPPYDTVFYQYLLDEVIARDLLARFEASPQQIFDPELGTLFRQQILMRMGHDADNAIQMFLGRNWNADAFGSWVNSMAQSL